MAEFGPEPTVTCDKCGRRVAVMPTGRGFPPDVAKRRLRRLCSADGCDGEPQYRAGIDPALARRLGLGDG